MAVAPEREGAGVSWVVENLQHPVEPERLPMQLTLVRSATRPAGKAQPLVMEVLHRGAGCAGAGKSVEEQPQAVLNLRIGIENHTIQRVVHEPQRQRHLQFATFGPIEDSTAQPGAQQMELRLREGPFKPEQESVVEVAGIVNAVLVEELASR